ncbi:MAG: glycogen synthase GlgA [Gammaproteobacteria bacterium]|nr:glycogen synthase GlgA [Gammaproteobacteria bacterium]
MKILFASSEAHPLIKTGGLADVCGALPKALHDLKQDVRLVLPAYQDVLARAGQLSEVARLTLTGSVEPVRVLEGTLPGTTVPVYLIDAPQCFDRPGNPYSGPDGSDWPDNAQRFAVFCRAIVELAQDRAGLHWRPDRVHCNDWQTGLVPALLSLESPRPATIFTVHNLAYQGLFDWARFQALKLPYTWWSMHALEFHGSLSFIKGGLVFADALTTVSPTYAEEIRTPDFGCGLDGLLTQRAAQLAGILNGADYALWDPASDPLLDAHFSRRSLKGKDANKQALQRLFGLPTDARRPLFAHVGRLVEQKGIDLVLDILPELMQRPLQLVMLGSGHAVLETALRTAQARYPDRLGVRIGYDEGLAHRIEAGADLFLMPSRFEPCGLNQLYSLRYGTLPIVRHTGGLADTVVDATPASLDAGTATGFVFDAATPEALLACIDRALHLYIQRTAWTRAVKTAMAQDFSWTRSAQRYLDLYRATRPTT